MSFPRYPKYKDSGVEWLGEVPEHWALAPLKTVASHNDDILNEETPPDLEINYVDISSVEAGIGIKTKEQIVFAAAPSRARRRVQHGDVIVSTVRTYLRAIARVIEPEANLVVSTGFAVIRPRKSLDPGFAGYLLSSSNFIEQVIARSTGVSYPAINASELVAIPALLPPIPEQHAIASFLDRETAKIDALIAEQQRLIELLQEKRQAVISHAVTKGLNPDAPIKDSGIEWLGEVPAHWTLPPLYARYEQVLGKMLDQSKQTGQNPMPYLRNVDVQWDSINTIELPQIDIGSDEVERFSVRDGDVLICEGGEVGRTAIWAGENNTFAFQKAIHRLRPLNKDECTRYFFYIMRFAAGLEVFVANCNPNTIPHLTGEQLRKYRFPKPSLEEQILISAYLDEESARFDKLINEARNAIALLQERRSALISAAVTGQIDVRGLAPKEAA
jgi:type I restriction enzyme S subunit